MGHKYKNVRTRVEKIQIDEASNIQVQFRWLWTFMLTRAIVVWLNLVKIEFSKIPAEGYTKFAFNYWMKQTNGRSNKFSYEVYIRITTKPKWLRFLYIKKAVSNAK